MYKLFIVYGSLWFIFFHWAVADTQTHSSLILHAKIIGIFYFLFILLLFVTQIFRQKRNKKKREKELSGFLAGINISN